ncbi:MAG TPA: response regulator [Acidimicrobiales bacterium]|nr:response regulator [Acidimicrobiales bacterium]
MNGGSPRARSVIVVDDMTEIRGMVRAVLHRPPHMVVVGEAHDGLSGIRLTEQTHPDVIILDRLMDPMSGDEALPKMREVAPESLIVIYSSFARPDEVTELLRLGADAVVDKVDGVGALEAALMAAPLN